jgi:DNA-directed RNA polymerase subunit L
MPPHLHNTDVEVTMMIKTVSNRPETVIKKEIKQISQEFRQLRQSISPDTLSIREMIEEGRRF